jgi:uncharacterized protein (TIGR02594 family)
LPAYWYHPLVALRVDFLPSKIMSDVNAKLATILDSSGYPPELRTKALDLLAQSGVRDEQRRAEEVARAENARLERAKIWLNTPIIAAVAGLLTLGGTHMFTLVENKETATLANSNTRILEERKFQFEMIKSALSDSKEPKQRATNLLFLIDSKILDGLDTEALKRWAREQDGETPAFASGSAAPRIGIEREYRTFVPEALSADLTNKAREAGTLQWMQYAIAELGVTEVPGPDNNIRIMEYARFIELQWPDFTEDIDWSGLFVNYVLKKGGFDQFPGSPLLNRNWATWGVALDQPKIGALAVLSPAGGSAGTGHVGFVVGIEDNTLTILGGNQRDSVSVAKFAKSRLVALRMPPSRP